MNLGLRYLLITMLVVGTLGVFMLVANKIFEIDFKNDETSSLLYAGLLVVFITGIVFISFTQIDPEYTLKTIDKNDTVKIVEGVKSPQRYDFYITYNENGKRIELSKKDYDFIEASLTDYNDLNFLEKLFFSKDSGFQVGIEE